MITSHTFKFVFCALVFALPFASHAATFSFKANPSEIGKGDLVEVTLLIDSDTAVNSFSGTLSYPATLLEPESVSDGNSIVSVWLDHPQVDKSQLTFTGFTPGGFSGRGGKLFSVIFRAKAAGSGSVSLVDGEVLRSDGQGTKEPLTGSPLRLLIGDQARGGFAASIDRDAPEAFTPYTATDLELFNGQTYLAFSAADKGSGIDRYEVRERRLPLPTLWQVTDSPYLIRDQYLTSDVEIRAVDGQGICAAR